MSLPPALHDFIELFNQGQYWQSHEVLEEAWRQNRSGFYQGLILYASAWVHLERGNRHGVEAQFKKAETILRPYCPGYLGLDVAALLANAPSVGRPFRIVAEDHRVRGDEPELKQVEKR